MSKKKQKLGPLQKEWVRALRSGKFKQAIGRLIAIPKGTLQGDELPCCCLGVACMVAHANGTRLHFEEIGHYGINGYVQIDNEASFLPQVVMRRMKFRSEYGALAKLFAGKKQLTEVNDYTGKTFKQIARFVEQNPEAVFTGPA